MWQRFSPEKGNFLGEHLRAESLGISSEVWYEKSNIRQSFSQYSPAVGTKNSLRERNVAATCSLYCNWFIFMICL